MGELPFNQIICGDCLDIMQSFPSDSVDLVVTDPPYGLGFMGKDWDKALPSKEAFKQIIRILKPGALAFVMSSPRQDLMWRMCALLEGVGFELRQSFISWIYKTGFPKAYDVSKGIDQKLGLDREIIGKYKFPNGTEWNLKEVKGSGGSFTASNIRTLDITVPASDLAREWDGWKSQTGLKPALEPILMVNKPFSEPTIVENVLQWGTGAINVDACRIPLKNESPRGSGNHENDPYFSMGNSGGNYTPEIGRFPANLLISDGALDTGEQSKSGTLEPHHVITGDGAGHKGGKIYGTFTKVEAKDHTTYGDEGDQSRYFDLDAWAQHHGFLDVLKPDTSERDFGLKGRKSVPKSKFNKSDGKNERFDGAESIPRRNIHPTVKPIKLMAYLIELGCPRNGVVLDPFVGSGTTCIAAKQLGRKYIGIELEENYHLLAEARVAAYPQPLEWFTGEKDA